MTNANRAEVEKTTSSLAHQVAVADLTRLRTVHRGYASRSLEMERASPAGFRTAVKMPCQDAASELEWLPSKMRMAPPAGAKSYRRKRETR